MIPTVTTFLNAMPGITKLKTLRVKFWNYRIFTNSNIMELINALTPQVCPHLRQLDIKSYLPSDVSDALVNIIKSHKKLEKIELDTYITTRSTKSVVVYNISDRASEKNVKDFFLFCGHISELKIIMNENENKQIAFITFKRETAAETALMLTNAIIADSQIIVKPLDDINHIYSKIFPVLNYVGDSLKELTLRYMDFSKISPDNIGNISKCQNLIRLKCINCKKMTSAHCTSLSKNQLNLKTLEITDSSLDQNIIIFLISMWGSTLEVLHLDKLSQETANALLIHCLNLKELVIYNLFADSLKFMLPFLQQSSLKSLLINAFSKSYLKYFDLGPYLPNTLTFLGLYTDFNNDDFETFVKYCGKFVDLKTLNIKRLNI
ncbi:28508_t:CDS:2 [Gigaspora margarita]|uniref:28508_t:CDS:1 n=1 Tax=Gigaspora margarita TaxID=4874 RepID=A0ABN7UNK3_GIGMA|nr:28508_t:CDS:2 [Gigaspora margarita]